MTTRRTFLAICFLIVVGLVGGPGPSGTVATASGNPDSSPEADVASSSSLPRQARKRKARRRRREKRMSRRRSSRNQRPAKKEKAEEAEESNPAAPEEAGESEVARAAKGAPADEDEKGLERGRGSGLRRSNRMEFDPRLVRGETAGTGAVIFFERAQRPLATLTKRRTNFLRPTIEQVFGRRTATDFEAARDRGAAKKAKRESKKRASE